MKKFTLLFTAFLTLALFAGSNLATGQTVIAYWSQNSNDLPGGGYGFLADPDVFPQSPDIGTGALTVGGGVVLETSSNEAGDLIYTWIPSFGGSALNVQSGFEAGGSISIQGGGTDEVLNNGAYIQFQFSMNNFKDLNVSYDTRGTSTGFDTQVWSYSTNGTDFTDLETFTGRNVTTFSTLQLNAANLQVLNQVHTVYLRVTLTGATTVTGNNRFDNLTFIATEEANSVSTGLASALKVYPNPFNDQISVSNAAVSRVSFTNLIGQTVLEVSPNGSEFISTSTLANGVYLVTFEGVSGERVVRKMIKR